MKRPEKKVEIKSMGHIKPWLKNKDGSYRCKEMFQDDEENIGYNKGRQDMIDFLPSEKEIKRLLQIYLLPTAIVNETAGGIFKEGANVMEIAKAIFKRNGGK